MISIEEAGKMITNIRQQYVDNRIGRWAVIEKSSQKFIGWAGFKLIKEEINNHHQYYDIGCCGNIGVKVMQQNLFLLHYNTVFKK